METLNVEFCSNKMILLASKKLESNHYHSNKRRDELGRKRYGKKKSWRHSTLNSIQIK